MKPFIAGKKVELRPFTSDLFSEKYLEWLNDPEVNEYSRRLIGPTNDLSSRKFIDCLGQDEHILAIFLKGSGEHVGNIQFGSINWKDSCAEIRIVVGDKNVWGKGVGTEAIYLVTKHLFEVAGLNRVEANTCNPAFEKCMSKLGWTKEGTMRQKFYLNKKFHDYHFYSILAKDFLVID